MEGVINGHAPIKRRKAPKKPVPFMNAQLRKACHYKAMRRNKYFRHGRTKSLWELYRKSRNEASKLKVKSMKIYFEEKCKKQESSRNPGNFWKTIKPFMTEKSTSANSCISLKVDESIISDPQAVCNVFNKYFSEVASNIGHETPIEDNEDIDSIVNSYEGHQSISDIQIAAQHGDSFHFREIPVHEMSRLIKGMDPKKGPGYDNIPPKLLKLAPEEFSVPLTALFNESLKKMCFPSDLKMSELAPLFKNKDSLLFGNYRPVSILPCTSKLFEKIYHDQLYDYFNELLSSLLAAFRKHFSCQHVLLKLVEDCKLALDQKKYVGLILMDLSKAFDCLPHRLLLCKLYHYGVSKSACQLIMSYLCERKQRVKIGYRRSSWTEINKGVPQGSVLGPLLFNIFINDLLLKFDGLCALYNYADDNTIGTSHTNVFILKSRLEKYTEVAIEWFEKNHMQANASKFQAMVMKSGPGHVRMDLNVSNEVLTSVDCVKLLGVQLDGKLNFDHHVSALCLRASFKIRALSRIGRFISEDCRMKLYDSFILPNFLYCSIVWHFGSKSSALKVEKVNKRALRVVLNDYVSSYPELLLKTGRSSLYVSRIKTIATEMYKCKNDINPAFVGELFTSHDPPYSLRNGEKF